MINLCRALSSLALAAFWGAVGAAAHSVTPALLPTESAAEGQTEVSLSEPALAVTAAEATHLIKASETVEAPSDATEKTDAAGSAAESNDETRAPEPAQPQKPELQILSAEGVALAQFLWEYRIVAVLADTPNDPHFLRQMRDIEQGADALIERDVVVLYDTNPRAQSPLRQLLRPRGFMLAIIEKDGAVAQRRPLPRDVREISAIIDRFPLRRQEILERLPARR